MHTHQVRRGSSSQRERPQPAQAWSRPLPGGQHALTVHHRRPSHCDPIPPPFAPASPGCMAQRKHTMHTLGCTQRLGGSTPAKGVESCCTRQAGCGRNQIVHQPQPALFIRRIPDAPQLTASNARIAVPMTRRCGAQVTTGAAAWGGGVPRTSRPPQALTAGPGRQCRSPTSASWWSMRCTREPWLGCP
jgi:hypothetical protein